MKPRKPAPPTLSDEAKKTCDVWSHSGRYGNQFPYCRPAPPRGEGKEQSDLELRQQLAQARVQRLTDLERYIKQGEFPHNHDFEGERVPYLVDLHGRLCAVAYLFTSSQFEDFNYHLFIRTNQVAVRSPNAETGADFGLHRQAVFEARYAESFSCQDGPAFEVQTRFENDFHESEARYEAQLRESLSEAKDGKDPGEQSRVNNAARVQIYQKLLREYEEQRADGSYARDAIEVIRNCGRHRAWFQALPNLAGNDNHVLVSDLNPGPLATWILSSGLTSEECSMIQPSYSFLMVSCDHCVAGSENGCAHIESRDYYLKIREENERIVAHLSSVLERLRLSSDESLNTATLRLQQARRKTGS